MHGADTALALAARLALEDAAAGDDNLSVGNAAEAALGPLLQTARPAAASPAKAPVVVRPIETSYTPPPFQTQSPSTPRVSKIVANRILSQILAMVLPLIVAAIVMVIFGLFGYAEIFRVVGLQRMTAIILLARSVLNVYGCRF